MHIAANVALVAVGVVAVLVVLDAALRTFVLPRGAGVFFTHLVFRSVRRTLRIFARPNRSYEARDRVMALYAPLALIAFPAVALVVLFGAFACFFQAAQPHGWRDALTTSGSSLFTLGFDRPNGLGTSLIAFTEAALGLALLAVLIAYLPTMYSSFSRRETMVTQLSVRAGTPPTAWRTLELAHRAGFLNSLDPVWSEWMQWFSELSETHTSLGALAFFRSPNPNRSWITAAGTVLDAASLRLAVLNIPFTPEPGLCIRSGFLALREIADFFGFDHDPDPSPDDPISVAREEFMEIYERLAGEGLPVRANRERAWQDFAGWRVNYDQVLLALCTLVMAPYAPWSSDRSPRSPLRRQRWARRLLRGGPVGPV
ncbi:MAG: hypothetical protein ACLPVY_26140 [Acidimicrobiia bacterium]